MGPKNAAGDVLKGYDAEDIREAIARVKQVQGIWERRRAEIEVIFSELSEEERSRVLKHLAPCRRRSPRYRKVSKGPRNERRC